MSKISHKIEASEVKDNIRTITITTRKEQIPVIQGNELPADLESIPKFNVIETGECVFNVSNNSCDSVDWNTSVEEVKHGPKESVSQYLRRGS